MFVVATVVLNLAVLYQKSKNIVTNAFHVTKEKLSASSTNTKFVIAFLEKLIGRLKIVKK